MYVYRHTYVHSEDKDCNLNIQERDPTTGFAQTAMKHGVPNKQLRNF